MNGPEKKMVYLSLVLLVLGMVYRFLPWGLPSIETFQVGEALVVPSDSLARPPVPSSEIVDKVNVRVRKKSAPKPPKVTLPVHINTASADMLCALKGVGPKLAEKIVAYREASGPFKSGKDLQKVPGIGKKKLETILQGVIFD